MGFYVSASGAIRWTDVLATDVLARTFWPGRFGQDVLATDVLATYIEKTDVLAKSIIYVLIIDIKATNIFNLLI